MRKTLSGAAVSSKRFVASADVAAPPLGKSQKARDGRHVVGRDVRVASRRRRVVGLEQIHERILLHVILRRRRGVPRAVVVREA